MQELSIPFESGSINASIRGGSKMVVFSHGFGVQRDSRGMFSELAESFDSDWGVLLFDYNDINGNNVSLRPYSVQQAMLKTVLEYVKDQYKTIVVVGHSMGAITVGLLDSPIPVLSILLAPPVHGPRPNADSAWAARPGAYYEGDMLIVPRKDGTISHIPQAFFDESALVDCPQVLEHYARHANVFIIQALEEDILSHTENYQRLQIDQTRLIALHGNHNFDSPHRAELKSTIYKLLRTVAE